MTPFPYSKKSSDRRAVWTGALLSVTVGLVFYVTTSQWIEGDSRERFANHARTAQNTIHARVKSYTDVLRGAASLFHSKDVVTRTQFHDYVAGLALERHFPAIEAINFSTYVRRQEMPGFLQRMRSEFSGGTLPPFQVNPPGERDAYLVLSYIEGRLVADATFGLDMLAVPYVQDVLMLSRDTGTLITSGKPIAAISSPNNIGLGMRLPIYQRQEQLRTIQDRRDAYIGSVGIAFSVVRLVQGVIDEMPVNDVRMILADSGLRTDGTTPNEPAVRRTLFDSRGSALEPEPPRDPPERIFSTTLPIDFNGRLWQATFSIPKGSMYTAFDEYSPLLAMLFGVVSTALIYALFHTLNSSRSRALEMAEGMTRELRESQAKLQLSHETLRKLAAHADDIKELERKRIAREIHDDLGQNLLALRIEAQMLHSRTREHHPRLHARARATLEQIDATIKSVRQIINDLRPNVLDLGLSAAVEWQVGEFARRTGIDCALLDHQHELHISDHCATALFRILQESLSNIAQHAKASHVDVQLHAEPDRISMTVRDNGVGLTVAGSHKPGSFGLVGIRERMNLLGGLFSITGVPGVGTTVVVSVPAERNSHPIPAVSEQHQHPSPALS